MNSCRICRTKLNLKYVPEQLATKRKKSNANEKQEILDTNASKLGNICVECEKRLLNFHKLDDQKDLEVDSGREETPVIVDDDDLLYNLFFENSKIEREREKHSLSSDCDTAVIELPSSREISPNLEVPKENIVAVIDLSDAAHTDNETKYNAVNKKRKRHKTYDEKQLIVLAKLNLVSSDSEEDEIYPPARTHIEKAVEKNKQEEEVLESKATCCVCQTVFSCNQQLVHHMRSRHRNNEEATQLRERMRHSQDSALTIRLCFQARYMYFECQMCGRVDGMLKEHKEHVIAKHSSELLSLKDPLLKRLQCPVCDEGCGSLYIEVCRHMLQCHNHEENKFFIKEIICNKDVDLQSVALTAQVYQFHSRPNLYFFCRHCKQLNSSIKSHRNHIKEKHQIIIEYKSTEPLQWRSLREKKKQPINIIEQRLEREPKKIGRPKKLNVNVIDNNDDKKVKTSAKKGVGVGNNEIKRRRYRRSTVENLQRVRVKGKPAVKQILIQNYNCQYCKQNFKGFMLWNLHNLKEHVDKVNSNIWKNAENFSSPKILHKREKRKKIAVDENFNNMQTTKSINKCIEKYIKIEEEEEVENEVTPNVPKWLQELLEMHQRKLEKENDDKKFYSSGLMNMKMRPNTAILKLTPNLKCIQLH